MAGDVPFVALDRQHAEIADDLRSAFERVLAASGYILGEEVERFEAEFAEFCGASHCVGVASGTAALTLALQAAGIGPGYEVIVPAHTFIASALAVVHAGARPVFCDVDEGTGLIDPAAAEAAVTERTAAVLPVHLYGQACDMDAIHALARRHALMVLEDAAQAHGATWRGGRTGSTSPAAAFSFYPSKNLGALGDGGAVCTNDPQIAERARALRHLGQLHKGQHDLLGWNERLDGLQAAFLRVKLPRVDSWNAARRERSAQLRAAIDGQVRMLEERAESPCIYHLFPIRVPDRDRFAELLKDRGVATGVHYSPAVPDQPPFRGLPRGDWPAATAWAREELSLPMFEHMTEAEVDQTAAAVTDAVQELAAAA